MVMRPNLGGFSAHLGVVVCLCLGSVLAQADTYYVDPVQGDDAMAGTSEAQPWKTITKVASASQATDTIVVRNMDASITSAVWPERIYQARVITQAAVTWTLAGDHRIGRFSDGAFWVVNSVTIAGVTPPSGGQPGIRLVPVSATSDSTAGRQWPILFVGDIPDGAGTSRDDLDRLCDSLVQSVSVSVSGGQVQAPETAAIALLASEYANHSPVLGTIGHRSGQEGQALAVTVSATDADTDPVTYSTQNLPPGAAFAGQTFSWTPTVGQAGSYQVTFTVSDGKGGTASQTVTITVAPAGTNRPPALQSIGNKSVVKGTQCTFSVSATDPDGDAITYSASGLPTGATLSGQAFAWTPGYDQVGTYPVTFTASDGKGGQDSKAATITVTNINRAPVLNAISDKSVAAGSALSFTVSGSDPDGDSLVYSASGLPSGATFSGSTFAWTPTTGQAGSYSVTITVSDGQLSASQAFSITVTGRDQTPPAVSGCRPGVNAVQAPLNTLVSLHVTDSGRGVDANSVTIQVDGQSVCSGNTEHYTNTLGNCRRTGTPADYQYCFQPGEAFGFDQQVTVTVTASDLAGNAMTPYTYAFSTEMRSFGKNWKVSSNPANSDKAHAVSAMDSGGNTWIAWHAGPEGSRDIYVARLDAQTHRFSEATQLTTNSADQCNPALAVRPDDQVVVVWQDNSRGNWDICGSKTSDGTTWSGTARLSDSNDQEIHPAIAVDHRSPPRMYVAWQDHRSGNYDVYVACTDNAFVSQTLWQVTSNATDQTDPAIAISADNTVFLVWADLRNGSADVYGASSNNGFASNVPIVTASGNQTHPAIAVEPSGSVLHLVWVDDTAGNADIYYATCNGLPSSPLSGVDIIDDATGAQQAAPAIRASSTGVFACWTDYRRAGGSTDTDLYFADLGPGSSRTNVLVGDEQTNSNQAEPGLGVDRLGHPYVVWTDSRSAHTEIYLAGNTYVKPEPFKSSLISASAGGTVGIPPASADSNDDVSVVLPAGACESDMTVSISQIENTPATSLEFLAAYDFGPSGSQFNQPVTVTIPYTVSSTNSEATPYWYDPLTDALSQQGITDIQRVVISSTLHALTFKTTHFTQFYLVAADASAPSGGGGGGGGCSLAPAPNDGQALEFLIPYMGLAVAMAGLRLRDRRKAGR